MPKALGIDFGSTNSCVAVMEGGEPVVIPNAEGARTTPSIVAITERGERLVGEAAKRQAVTNPQHTISSITRFIGRTYDDPEVDRDKRLMPYKVVRASNGDAWVEVQGRQYSPPEIVAMILQKLKMDAEEYLGEQVPRAIMTVPCFFNARQCQAIKDAGHIAGLEVLRLLRNSTAAALTYGLDRKKDERVAIYDLGGGTFDISILELGDGVFEVKSVNGDTHQGGDDFDQRIIAWLADEFRKEQGIDLRQDRMALQRLKEAAEKAKKELSSSMYTEINLPSITGDAKGPKHLTMTLTRAKLEQLVEDLIEKSRDPVMKALSDAGCRPGDVNEVVLVGGQTRMPAVQTMVRRIFDREPNTSEYKHHKEEIEERNLADSAAYRVEKSIAELGNRLTSEQKSELKSRIADIRAVLASGNIVRIKSAREALEKSFHKISEAIYHLSADREAPHADFGGDAQPNQKHAPSFAGQQVGNYQLLKQLGRGGFATVYLGEHRYIKTYAAIKVLHTHMQKDAIQAFLQEAQAIARLKHHHIVRVLDFGVENAIPFLVMEYASHGTLRDWHPLGTRLSLATILPYVRQMASALQYAHQQKIVHRDVKPENMLLEADGTLLLSDFGIAVPAHQTNSLPLQEASGTAAYMAPEHIQGKARPASEYWSLAVVIYEWLCGRRPFGGATFMEIVMQHVNNPPPSLRAFVPELPPMVEQVVLTALAKDPKQRFATVQAFATAFEYACQ